MSGVDFVTVKGVRMDEAKSRCVHAVGLEDGLAMLAQARSSAALRCWLTLISEQYIRLVWHCRGKTNGHHALWTSRSADVLFTE